jgi:hypothetical protein
VNITNTTNVTNDTGFLSGIELGEMFAPQMTSGDAIEGFGGVATGVVQFLMEGSYKALEIGIQLIFGAAGVNIGPGIVGLFLLMATIFMFAGKMRGWLDAAKMFFTALVVIVIGFLGLVLFGVIK